MIRVIDKDKYIHNHKNAVKIGHIGKELFVVTMEVEMVDGKREEVIKIHTLIQKQGDKVEYVPNDISDEMLKKIMFY